MRKTAMVLAAAITIGVTAVASPSPAEARWRGGFGPGIAAGLIGAAVIGGLASSAYAYGPGYGPYYGYDPIYYGAYDPYPWGGYSTTYYSGYAPAYYGYRYRRVVRPAFAYYGGPVVRHHRWHRHHW